MLVLQLIEYVAIVLFLVVLVVEVIWPLFNDRPIFPHFTKQRKIENQISATKQELISADMEVELRDRQNELVARRAELTPQADPKPTQGEPNA